jgi:hypothetical protein
VLYKFILDDGIYYINTEDTRLIACDVEDYIREKRNHHLKQARKLNRMLIEAKTENKGGFENISIYNAQKG